MINPAFARIARSYRSLAGLSIRAWAEALKVNKDTVVRWEKGIEPHHPEAMLRLMERVARESAGKERKR